MMGSRVQRIVIVGGVAGGASAATRARRLDEHAIITIFEKDEHVSFANCGLPYFIGGEIAKQSALLVVTPELFETRFRVRVRTLHEVTAVDRERKVVLVHDRSRGEDFEEPYDKLILAPGAAPVLPSGGPPPRNVFTLRNVADSERIRTAIRELGDATRAGSKVGRAVIVGSGYVGLEMVEQLHRAGLATVLVESATHVLPLLDPEMSNLLVGELERNGVELVLGSAVQSFERDASGALDGVVLASGARLAADVVIVGIGVRPNLDLPVASGLEIGAGGGIASDSVGRTNDPDIYAVGDAVEYCYQPTEERLRVPLAGPANRSGRVAGGHAASGRASTPVPRVLGTSIVRVFDKVAAMTGLTEKACKRLGRPAASVIIAANDHAGYYPGAQEMALKLVYEPLSGKILGAQAVGGRVGVDKRIDVIATALRFGASVRDLSGLDLAYAPPFGAAKDPVHVAGFVASNVLDGLVSLVPPNADLGGRQVVDVRTPSEVARQSLAGAADVVPIPLDELRDRIGELDPSRPTVVFCASGRRSYLAARILTQRGFTDVQSLSGGVMMRNSALGANSSS